MVKHESELKDHNIRKNNYQEKYLVSWKYKRILIRIGLESVLLLIENNIKSNICIENC